MTNTFMDFGSAAKRIGISTRHFRRIVESENIRIVGINGKFHVLTSVVEDLKSRWPLPKKKSAAYRQLTWDGRFALQYDNSRKQRQRRMGDCE